MSPIQTISDDSALASTSYQPQPARKQVTQVRLKEIREYVNDSYKSSGTYNIWHENYSGGDHGEDPGDGIRAQSRCDVIRDSGYTKADLAIQTRIAQGMAPQVAAQGTYHCLFFARGCCPNGVDCNFLHRLPRPNDALEQGRDIFGRGKYGDYRDDMGGVGSMQRINKTLYVGRLGEEPGGSTGGGKSAHDARKYAGDKPAQQSQNESPTEKVLRRHFSEWGEITHLRVLHGRSCGFVTYKTEASAQFAKEAMFHQAMDHNEILNVRWATDDPNREAQKRGFEELEVEGQKAIMFKLMPEQIEAQRSLLALEDEDPEAKRRRLDEEEEIRRMDEENQRGWEEYELEQQAARFAAQKEQAKTNGLLDAEAIGNLKALNALRQKQKQTKPTPPPKAVSALSSLAAYGSDSEEE